jgi:16S rRNA (cytosine1402-N4)-methyltransferase
MTTPSNGYHVPVLLHAAVEGLEIKSDGIYVDVTFGGGGHSREILKKIETGTLCAFDQDPDAAQNQIQDSRFRFFPENFSRLKNALHEAGIMQVDGILADLGVSSHQFDDTSRGFSLRFDAPLDMRMDTLQPLHAGVVVNEYEEAKLKQIFREYGEVENAGKLAWRISEERKKKSIDTTGDLLKIIDQVAPFRKEKQYQAKVFQAIRIEVNDEMHVLRELLLQSLEVLKPGGRLVVIAYHSLEDRLVKNFMRSGNLQGEIEKDFFGRVITPIREITRKPMVPDEAEMEKNPRARSAKLRIAQKQE